MEDADSPLTLNGVVYNEMKGAFSSPDEVHDREVVNSLYPDTPYGVESGGDPKVIPTLSYEQFLDFHRRYYHPSNSYLYLYGNMDMAEKLEWIDAHYLSQFDKLEIDSALRTQAAFEKPVETSKEYPIMEGESLEDNTYLSYNTVVGTSLDKELYYAMEILEYALCSASAAPLKLALIHKNIGYLTKCLPKRLKNGQDHWLFFQRTQYSLLSTHMVVSNCSITLVPRELIYFSGLHGH